jgi:nucleoside-diphosphate-sugar epimerase
MSAGDGNGTTRAGENERFLVTGAHGCIGAWVIRRLISEGAHVVALDVSPDDHRLRLVLSDGELSALPLVRTDITDLDSLERTLAEHEITNIIHLAALQVPFCRADPSLGARVNVVGTVNVLEAAARSAAEMAPVVYASSIAAYDAVDAVDSASPRADAASTLPSANGGVPGTLYGVYKRANERPRAAQHRPAPPHRLWPRPRSGPHLITDRRDARRCRGKAL